MKKTSLAAIAAMISFASFANTSGTDICDDKIKMPPEAKIIAPVALATYKSKCGETWDFVIPYTNLRQVPGLMTQMVDDADKACGTNISYYEY